MVARVFTRGITSSNLSTMLVIQLPAQELPHQIFRHRWIDCSLQQSSEQHHYHRPYFPLRDRFRGNIRADINSLRRILIISPFS